MWKYIFLLGVLGFVSPIKESSPGIFPNKENVWDPLKYQSLVKKKDLPFSNCWTRDCVIQGDDGGVVIAYTASALKVKETTHKVVLNGRCYSACTGFLDLIKDHVCISPKTVLLYHADTDESIPSWYSDWAMDWVVRHGGFPTNKSGHFLAMKFKDAKNHWRVCTKKELDTLND